VLGHERLLFLNCNSCRDKMKSSPRNPMAKSLLKLLAVSSIVLLLGQVRVGKATIGEHYFNAASRAWVWSGNEIKKTPLYTKIVEASLFQRWVNNVYPPPAAKEVIPAIVEELEKEEVPAATDRESILKLLD